VLFRDVRLCGALEFHQECRLECGLLGRQVDGEATEKALHTLPAPLGLVLPDVRGRMLSSGRHGFAPRLQILLML